jgi:hypothetical protein
MSALPDQAMATDARKVVEYSEWQWRFFDLRWQNVPLSTIDTRLGEIPLQEAKTVLRQK